MKAESRGQGAVGMGRGVKSCPMFHASNKIWKQVARADDQRGYSLNAPSSLLQTIFN